MSRHKKLTPEQEQQIARLIGMGWTFQLIADELGVPYTTVWDCAKRLGIKSEYVGGRTPKNPVGAHHRQTAEDHTIEYVTGQKSWEREE